MLDHSPRGPRSRKAGPHLDTNDSPLLALPAEMRLEIYNFTITASVWMDWTKPALAHTCRQIQAETLTPLVKYLQAELSRLKEEVESLKEASKSDLVKAMISGEMERLLHSYFDKMRCRALLAQLLESESPV